MITILSGQNDICSGDPCYPSAKSAALEHYENLRKALDYLQANLPRTFVNLLPVLGNIIWRQSVTLFKHYLFLDVTAGWRIEKSLLCGVMSVIECRCLYGPGGAENIQKLKAVVKAYHSAEKQLVRAPAPFNRIMLFPLPCCRSTAGATTAKRISLLWFSPSPQTWRRPRRGISSAST